MAITFIVSLVLGIISEGIFLITGNLFFEKISPWIWMPAAVVFSYIGIMIMLFGAQLFKKIDQIFPKIVFSIFLAFATFIFTGFILTNFDGYFEILDKQVFYDQWRAGTYRINENFRILLCAIAALLLVINISMRNKNFMTKLPFFND